MLHNSLKSSTFARFLFATLYLNSQNNMKKMLFGLVAAMLSLTLWATPRTAEEAASIAASFVNDRPALRKMHKAPQTAASMRLAHTRQKTSSQDNAFYVFNRADNAGFIIVSADDRTNDDILGYSDGGVDFDMETINPHLRWWLERYEEEISSIQDNDPAVAQPRKALQVSVIAPLLKNQQGVEITWYQEEPYSNLCPMDQRDNTRSLTGCVATAASQVMYKWRHPAQGTGSHSYTWYDCMNNNCTSYKTQTLSLNFANTTFDWDNMLPSYEGKSYTDAQANAVATLMYNAGVACNMQYGGDANSGSGAWTDDMAYGLKTYFGYKFEKFITMYSKDGYKTAKGTTVANVTAEYSVTTDQITTYFNADLEAGRPIVMGGESTNDGGHEFVCDGRDANNKFHINWGWEGSSNGYFKITSLRPSGYGSFSNHIDAIIGLEPNNVAAEYTIRFFDNGQQLGETQVVAAGQQAKKPADPKPACDAYTFVGWWTEPLPAENTSAKAWITDFKATQDQDYYAIYKLTEDNAVPALTDNYLKIKAVSDLENGNYLIVANNNGAYNAMSTEWKDTYYLAGKDVTPSNDVITTQDASIIWNIALSNNQISLQNSEAGYLYIEQSGTYYNIKLGDNQTDNKFTCEIDASKGWLLKSVTYSDRLLEYYVDKTRWAFFKSADAPVYLYKQQMGGGTHYTSVETCGITAIQSVTSETAAQKILRNGEVLIIRNGQIYSLTGQRR